MSRDGVDLGDAVLGGDCNFSQDSGGLWSFTAHARDSRLVVGRDAMHGIAGDFVSLVLPHSEADEMALLIQFLAAAGNAMTSSPHVMIEGDKHPAKIWPVLVGPTSAGRKGTSLSRVANIIDAADPTWKPRRRSNVGSGEVLVWEVRDKAMRGKVEDEGVSDKRLFAAESEFAGLLRSSARDGSILSPMLRQAWDTGDLRSTVKTNPAAATDAHITVIGHITKDELRKELTGTDSANGFANRFLWVEVARSKSLPRGSTVPPDAMTRISNSLRTYIDDAKRIRSVTLSGGFWAEYVPHYDSLSSGPPGLLGAVLGRGAPYVYRLALIYALLDGSSVVDANHTRAALAVWQYCAESAKRIFGGSTGDWLADEILRELKDSEEGMTRTEIRDMFSRNRSIALSLNVLLEGGYASVVKETTAGRPSERWKAEPEYMK